jgi:hypothetical protein
MAQRETRSSGQKRRPAEVVGVVHPLGAGGGRAGTETLWTLRFSFSVWRRIGGEIEERQLSIQRPNLSDAELRAMMESIKPYDILRVHLRFDAIERVPDVLQGELIEVLGKESSDDELNTRAEQLRQPVTVEHPFFGTVTLNRALNWYEAALPWNSRITRLYLSREGCEKEQELFEIARRLWDQQKRWDKRIRDYAVEKLLGLKNDLWLGEDEKEFTPARFKARMTVESITVYPDGSFEFTYDDGNLFWGHVIQVSGMISGGLTHAGIAG